MTSLCLPHSHTAYHQLIHIFQVSATQVSRTFVNIQEITHRAFITFTHTRSFSSTNLLVLGTNHQVLLTFQCPFSHHDTTSFNTRHFHSACASLRVPLAPRSSLPPLFPFYCLPIVLAAFRFSHRSFALATLPAEEEKDERQRVP